MSIKHSVLLPSEIHVPYSFTALNSTALLSISVQSGDVGKLCRQLDENKLFMLTSSNPITWKEIGIDLTGLLASKVNTADLGTRDANNGYAGLDSGGKISTSVLPSLAIVDVHPVADIPARDALTVQKGDVAIVASNSTTYICVSTSPTVWTQILTPASGVQSFNGRAGPVTSAANDYAANQVTCTSILNAVPAYTGSKVQDAIDYLNANKSSVGHSHSFDSLSNIPDLVTLDEYGLIPAGSIPANIPVQNIVETYTPQGGQPTDVWAGTPPADLESAINRIAVALATHLGVTIPE